MWNCNARFLPVNMVIARLQGRFIFVLVMLVVFGCASSHERRDIGAGFSTELNGLSDYFLRQNADGTWPGENPPEDCGDNDAGNPPEIRTGGTINVVWWVSNAGEQISEIRGLPSEWFVGCNAVNGDYSCNLVPLAGSENVCYNITFLAAGAIQETAAQLLLRPID